MIVTTQIFVTNREDGEFLIRAGIGSKYPAKITIPPVIPTADAKEYAKGIESLFHSWEATSDFDRFIFAGENTRDVRHFEREVVRRLGPERCFYPARVAKMKARETLAQAFEGVSPEEAALEIDNSLPFPIEGVHTFSGAAPSLLDYYRNGIPPGLPTGFGVFDHFYKVRPGELTVVTGYPGSGKSEFLDALAVNLAVRHGWPFCFYTPENEPFELHQAKLLEKFIKKPFNAGASSRMSEKELELAQEWAESHFYYLLPKDPTVPNVLEKARVCVLRYGVKGVIIDPWNYLEHSRPPNMTEVEYQSWAIGLLARFAKANQVHLWVIAHPTKIQKDKDTKERPVPGLYDISGSAHWANKADNGLSVWRDFSIDDRGVQSDSVFVHVLKVRHKITGRVGKQEFRYYTETGTYDAVHV